MKTYRFRTFSLTLFGSKSRSRSRSKTRSRTGSQSLYSGVLSEPTLTKAGIFEMKRLYGPKPKHDSWTFNHKGNSKKKR